MIAEPTLEQYIYYLRWVEGDSTRATHQRRAAFEGELGTLLAHLERLSGQPIPTWEWPQESEDRDVSQRIVRTDWLDNPHTGRSCFVAARTYGDVYWLQVGYCQSGQEIEPEIFASLRDEAWQPSAADHLLGSSTYLCGIAASPGDELAAQVLKGHIDNSLDTLVSTRLANGCVGLHGSSRQPHVTVLLYPDARWEEWAGRVILNDVALRLELYKHKADRQLAWCEESIKMLSRQERSLRSLLERANRAPATGASRGDVELWQQLVRLYRVYNGNAGMLVDRQTTIEINLNNLDAVLKELEPLTEDRFLGPSRDRLRRRQKQLETDLKYANQPRQQAEATINALIATLGLNRLASLRRVPGNEDIIAPAGWPGTRPQVESEMDGLTLRPKPTQIVIYPRVEVSTNIKERLAAEDRAFLRQVYRGFRRVLVEKEFGGGYGGARVLRILPITTNDYSAARKVTKIGPAAELRKERDNYVKYVEEHLPFCAARVEWERYCEQDGRAGLNYVSVGGGSLGEVTDLEEYYRRASPETAGRIIKTLGDLLGKELGERWYSKTADLLQCFFAAEYGQHMVGHLRLKLRSGSSDALWLANQPPTRSGDYDRIEIEDIPYEYDAMKAGAQVSFEGMAVRKIKHNVLKLQDPDDPGTVVRVELPPGSDVLPQGLELESRVGVRGQVVYNRRDRMEQIVRAIFPRLSPVVSSKSIELPGVPGTYPNPLRLYPTELGKVLEGLKSYVHGDLHLRNVLVDEAGKAWLIDFAKVTERHNLFDFIKLETYVRLMELGRDKVARTFSLGEYTQFEQALADATLGIENGTTCPENSHLQVAHKVILAMRDIARKHMGADPDFRHEYFRALFLYCLAVIKYHQDGTPHPTRLVFATSCVLGRYILGVDGQARPTAQPLKGTGESLGPEPHLGTRNRWAVLVGVDEYEDRANYGPLHVCVQDVGAIREQLIAGDFYPIRIRLLTDQTADVPPTRANILTALKAVADATEPDDLLLFYYSGHGDEENSESYLVTRDGRKLVLSDTAVSISRVKEIMEQAPARAKVIVLDACHSGADVGGKGPQPMSAEFIRRVFEEAEGLAILASCKQGQLSYEWRAHGCSVFTHFLLEALTGEADREEKGFVTIQDANRHVTGGVKLWASQNDVSQTPTLQSAVAGDIILVRYS